jgi:hypothetical protein
LKSSILLGSKAVGAGRECWQKDLLAERGEASRELPCGRVGAIIISASHIPAILLGLESGRSVE